MSLATFVRKQFIDIVEWTEDGDDVLAWRFPTEDREIQQGAQLIVRETQAACFVHEGLVADVFGPGRHVIRTQNVPVLTDLRHWDKRFQSPFKSEVYFFSSRLRLNQTWGTSRPFTIRDPEFGAVQVRAYGIYSYRIKAPRNFFEQVSGTREAYLVGDLEGHLRHTLVATLSDHFAERRVAFLDMAANQAELAAGVRDRARPIMADLGLSLESFQIENISLPEALQARLDERLGMALVGDAGPYTRFQVARSIPLAAGDGNGTAGAGVGVGAGIAMGQAMAQAVGQPMAQAVGQPMAQAVGQPMAQAVGQATATPSPSSPTCPRCRARLDRPSRFCPECGASLT